VASTSRRHFLVENELTEVVNAIESEDEYSEVSNLGSYYHLGDGDENDCVVTDQTAPQHSRKTNSLSPPSFQWLSGVLCPVTHISVAQWCVVSSHTHFSGTVVCCVQSHTLQFYGGVLCPVTRIAVLRWCVVPSHTHFSGAVLCCVQSHIVLLRCVGNFRQGNAR
jgi:hypothetical protein